MCMRLIYIARCSSPFCDTKLMSSLKLIRDKRRVWREILEPRFVRETIVVISCLALTSSMFCTTIFPSNDETCVHQQNFLPISAQPSDSNAHIVSPGKYVFNNKLLAFYDGGRKEFFDFSHFPFIRNPPFIPQSKTHSPPEGGGGKKLGEERKPLAYNVQLKTK